MCFVIYLNKLCTGKRLRFVLSKAEKNLENLERFKKLLTTLYIKPVSCYRLTIKIDYQPCHKQLNL